ncbi:MAG: choice-of-anchor T family protein [Candidatus Thermoplasmatota archaeon]
MRKSLKLISLIGIVLVATTAFFSTSVQAQYIPRNSFFFEKVNAEIESEPGTSRTVTFNGSMESSCETTYTVELCIESAIPQGWSVAVSPAMVKHTAGVHTDYINVVVMAPPEASHAVPLTIKIQSYTCRIEAGLRYYGASITLSVSVKPYYRLAIECSAPYQEIAPGKEVAFGLRINNLGNTDDYFRFEILNRDELGAAGWYIPAEISTIKVLEKRDGNLTVKLIAPRDWTLWRDDVVRLDVKIISDTSKGAVSETFYLYVRQRGTYIPGFDSILLIIALTLVAIIAKKKLFTK